jgi:hypothetical protein
MKSQSFGFVLLVVGFLVPSCSQQNTSTQTASEGSTNSQPIPQKTFTPITGAFGWKLGESLHSERYEIETNKDGTLSYSSGLDSTSLPFEQVIVRATKEGLIYEITGYITPKDEEYSNVKKGIIDALAEKYQILPGYIPNTAYCEFGDKTNSVELEDRGSYLALSYKNTPLLHVVLSDYTKKQIRKEKAIQDSFKGL